MLRLGLVIAKAASARIARLSREAALALGGAVGDREAAPRRLWIAMAIILPIAFLVWTALHSVTLVMSPSIDAWMVRQATGPVGKGDLVSFSLVHPLAGPDPVNVTKRVLCVPGEILRQVEILPGPARRYGRSAYLCAGKLVGITRPFGRNGQRLAAFPWGVHPIPAGYVYLGSDHPDGFDSRYYGPVKIERLTRMERVL